VKILFYRDFHVRFISARASSLPIAEPHRMDFADQFKRRRFFRTGLADQIHSERAGLTGSAVFLLNTGVCRFGGSLVLEGISNNPVHCRRIHYYFKRNCDLFISGENFFYSNRRIRAYVVIFPFACWLSKSFPVSKAIVRSFRDFGVSV